MRECITHHHACDCRETEFAGWKARAEEAEKTLHHEKTDNARYLARTWAERDAALMRAEQAEALTVTLQHHFDNCNANKIVTITLRAERAETALGKSWYFEMVKTETRAEQAEMLLREALTEMDAGGYWASQVWRAKVRDLLKTLEK